MKSVYVHVPFCSSICTYCDFCKMFYDSKIVSQYLDELEKEIKSTYKGESIRTIYIGGGTPSALKNDELEKIFSILNTFNKDNLLEYTVECNIENIDEDKLKILKSNGVNRLSIGVQSFNNKLLTILGRNHTKENVIKTIEKVKKYGFNNINVDLIYGINGETIDDLKDDVNTFLKLDISHISLYSLIIEPHTKLFVKDFNELDEDLNALMYEYINDTLKENNYVHYEISNYAKEGFQSKHNLVYWHNEEYYGFGLGASSFVNNKRYDNTKSINRYFEGKYIANENALHTKENMQNEMILGLRLAEGVNKDNFYKKYGVEMSSIFPISSLIEKGLLKEENNYVFIPEDKLFVSNEILIEFLD